MIHEKGQRKFREDGNQHLEDSPQVLIVEHGHANVCNHRATHLLEAGDCRADP